MSDDRNRNGRPVLREFMATVTSEHFVSVRAADAEQASTRAIREMESRMGRHRKYTVNEIEEVA